MSVIEDTGEAFHIPPEAAHDPDDRAYLKDFPDNYDDPGPRWFQEEGTAMINGTRADAAHDVIFHQKAIVGPAESLSTYVYGYAPDAEIGNHYHDVDQLQFITGGEAWLGNRRLRPGEGLLTPAGNKYSFRAGPKGVRMYELRRRALFRHGTADETEIDGWVRKREHKSVFFDLETATPQPISTADGAYTLAGTYRTLVEPHGNDAMSLYAIDLETDAVIPANANNCQRQIIGYAGQITIGDHTLRRGDGMRCPSDEPVEITAGPGGATFIVHRAQPTWTTTTPTTTWQPPDQLPGLPF